ncbi:hypothetical protein G6L37_03120 [Agrobacterium rubi]|nr:hypothetical protein [Agrobacterium rubi]NTF24366.1 hypothetical protein [Agrobacterium rubi]
MDDHYIEFFEVRFESETCLDAARHALHIRAELGSGAVLVSGDMMSREEIVHAALSAGVPVPDISDSGLSDEDMWPEWQDDGDCLVLAVAI